MSIVHVPAISVVLAARNCGPALARCLDSLARQTRRDLEVIVASTCGPAPESVWPRFPVRHLPCDASLDDPQLLRAALEEARGGIVAVIDPHCIVPADWLERLLQAHNSEFAVIGGAVEHGGPDTLTGWACYLADYGGFVACKPRQVTSVLAGSHISYKRAVLDAGADSLRHGYWKVFFLDDLARRGLRFLFDPGIVVLRIQDAGFTEFARRYYQSGCRFAAARARMFSPPARFARVVTAPALPPLLLYRRIRSAWSGGGNRGRLLAALPLIALLVCCWSAGEAVGYLRGSPAPSRAE